MKVGTKVNHWTEKDDNILRENYRSLYYSDKESLFKLLPKRKDADIKTRASRLGITLPLGQGSRLSYKADPSGWFKGGLKIQRGKILKQIDKYHKLLPLTERQKAICMWLCGLISTDGCITKGRHLRVGVPLIRLPPVFYSFYQAN